MGAVRARLVPVSEKPVPEKRPAWPGRVVAGVLVVALLLAAFSMIRSCSPSALLGGLTNPGLLGGPARTLPGPLATADCEPRDRATGAERCVLAASDPLLSGGITGDRELVLRVQVVAPGELTRTVRRWRAAGGSVVADGQVFAAVSAASAVLYADTDSGLRIDTGAFANKAAAQTFLSRSGLLG